jgi:acyl-CoA dehydrogenase
MSSAATTESHADDLARLVQDLARDSTPRLGPDEPLGSTWDELMELGLTSVSVPESAGGSGGELADEVVLVVEAAASGLDLPLVEALTAAWLLSRLGHVTAAPRGIVVGSGLAGAREAVVPWGRHATDIVLVDTANSMAVISPPKLNALSSDLAGRPLDSIEIPDGLAWGALGDLGLSADIVEARLAVLRTAQLLGTVRAALRLTGLYVNEREQFGRPLIALPAVAASLAHMRTQELQVECGLERAVGVLSNPKMTAETQLSAAAAARVRAGRAATDVAARSHQLHGAIGVTEEYELGRHTRRLWSLRDADLAEREWSERLGAAARTGGESRMWDRLTQP